MFLLPMHAARLRAAIVVIGLGIVTISGAAAPTFSPWSVPVNLGTLVNSTANEQGPAISRDGLSLFFGSARSGGFGDFDIWVAHRTCVSDPWSVPTNVLALNSTSLDSLPTLSPDEHWIFFTSSRPGGFGDADLWAAYRSNRRDDIGWETPINLGSVVNSTAFEAAPEFTRRRGVVDPLFFFARGPNNTALDIWMSQVSRDGTLSPPAPVTELNSTASDARASVRSDLLEIFFYSNRTGGVGLNDLWTSTRRKVTDPWSPPTNVGAPVNTTFNEVHPELSRNRRTLYFVSGRPGPFPTGQTDLWATTRTQLDDDESEGCEEEEEE
jgi:Tol biopolymer transport system component